MTPFIWLLRASLLLLAALLAERAVSALRLRRLLLLAGAVGALALPLLAFELPSLTAALPSVSAAQVTEWVGLASPTPQPSAATTPSPLSAPLAAGGGAWSGGLLWVWGLGSVLLAVRALLGRAWLAREVWRSPLAPAQWQDEGGAPLRISAALPGAGLAGPWPRAVLLPAAAVTWPAAERAQVLRHEQAHARAGDDWSLLLMQALTVVLWPTPLAWWAQRRARLVAELAADDAVVGSGASPLQYAETLARLAGARQAGLVAASTRGMLEARVRALLSGRRAAAGGGQLTLAGVGALGITVLLAAVPGTAASGTRPAGTLQEAVDAELARIQADWHPEDAAIVVVDVQDGTILARGDLHGTLLDRPIEVGSTLKPFTVAAALESGIPADVVLPGRGGRWSVGGVTIEDHRAAESLSLSELLAWSSNIGAAALVDQVGVQAIRDTMLAAGLDTVPEVADHTPAAAHLGMGLGVSVSPTALAQAYRVFGADDSPLRPQTVAAVRAGLAAAIGPDGTAHAAAVPGALGGKTGTARYGDSGDYVASFAGLWETAEGTAAVSVVVAAPETDRPYGGAVAAPVFARLLGH